MVKVLKFGGSSVANAENISKVIQIIASSLHQDTRLIVVVSALGGVTDNLIKVAALASSRNEGYKKILDALLEQHTTAIESLIDAKSRKNGFDEVQQKCAELSKILEGVFLLGELSLRTLDRVMSYGEQLSAFIINEALNASQYHCDFVDARDFIKTDESYGSASVNAEQTVALLQDYFQSFQGLSIMGGFIASTDSGVTTTLGRGGSDYTASLVGAALNADVIEIWTDVSGVMTADPNKVKDAFPLDEISYEEAGELAHFGAKVIYPKTMKPARLKNIPIIIKNTFHPEAQGTKIGSQQSDKAAHVKGISTLGKVVLLSLQYSSVKSMGDIAAKIFDTLSRAEITVLLTTQASHEHAISIAVNQGQAEKAKYAIEKAFFLELNAKEMLPVSMVENLSIVAIVGKGMKGVPGISGRFFNTLGVNKVNVVAIAQGSSELNVSAVIHSKDEIKALQAIHRVFFSANKPCINLFLAGIGLVGSTLVEQIKQSGAPISLCGVANSQQAFVNPDGILWDDFNKVLKRADSFPADQFVAQIQQLNLPNSIYIDCTASDDTVLSYQSILKSGISIVTPNKKGNSGSQAQYQALRDIAAKHKAKFLYETNVGAGLPIIQTLQNLMSSGDEIIKIEGVLSGTLSYIFNSFSDSEKSFSEIVKEAKQKGFTEPDPRDDLNGMDVARKILILAREVGLSLELDQVEMEPLLPKACFSAASLEDFFRELKNSDAVLQGQKNTLKKEGKVLRVVASLEGKKATVALQSVDERSPFYHLSGSENMIVITSKRYLNSPLVIRGPGAGAEVTAGGVFADIMTILKGVSDA